LKSLCTAGINFRYPDASKPERAKVILRLNYELSIIGEKGFSSYFLVVHDIVSRYSRTCGRGSSASSIVSYLLGITHVDPVKYNLFFERFLNRSRKDPPDIDVDFPWDERRETLEYVFKTYRGHSGMVADHVTFGPRSSLREPAKALGFPEEEIKRFVRYLRLGKTDKLPGYLLRISGRIRGFPRHMGTHPGGVVITPEEITNYTHIQPSPLGYPLTAWDKDSTEDAGLVKIDLLGNRSLAVLRDVIELVNREAEKTADDTGRKRGKPAEGAVKGPVKWNTFNPLENAETAKMLARGDTIGIFYVESPATRQLLKKMKKGDF
ncbi:MAG: DNA polymerase III subunit alpha, partial [Spirochaetes bacterium]|nr:DNA polymerase III subunit alpha [Spirochaetota bacterium]